MAGKPARFESEFATAVSWHGLVVDSFREFRRRQPGSWSWNCIICFLFIRSTPYLSGRLDAGFAARMTPWDTWDWRIKEIAQDRMVLAVPTGHPLTETEDRSIAGSAEQSVHLVPSLGQPPSSTIE